MELLAVSPDPTALAAATLSGSTRRDDDGSTPVGLLLGTCATVQTFQCGSLSLHLNTPRDIERWISHWLPSHATCRTGQAPHGSVPGRAALNQRPSRTN